MARTDRKSDDDLQGIVKAACEEAIDFIESEIAEVRNKCQRYYEGEVDIGHEEGTSKVVATKVRDCVRIIMPNLMRVFLASEKPVEFVPKRPEDVDAAKQATDYLWAEFRRLKGFQTLYEAMHDAVVKKAGFIKAYWDETDRVEHHKFDNISDEELALIEAEEGVEIVEITSEPVPLPEGLVLPEGLPEPMTHNIKIERTVTTGQINMEVIPPEDFFVDEGATCLEDALVYGYQTAMRVTDLVDMGFSFEEVSELGLVSEDDTTEKYERADYTDDYGNLTHDPAMKEVTVTECFMKVDVEGDGKAVLHRFLCGGAGYKILEKEKWTGSCIAVFEADPVPHLFFGQGEPELLFNDQDAATSMLRGLLNNIASVNLPRSEVNDEYVNMDDYMNNELGGIVRVKQMGMINQFTTEAIADRVLPAMQYYDGVVEGKAGVNNLSAGLNPDLLQNQTATAVNAVTQAGANQIEAITRHLAEGGMTDLFRIMLELVVENAPDEVMMRTADNQFVPMDPRSWNVDMDMHVNVGLGAGGDSEKAAALASLIPLQKEALMASHVTGMTSNHLRNSISDVLKIAGLHDIDRYWPQAPPPPPPQPMQQPDPTQALVAVEQVKGQNRLNEKMMELQVKMAEMAAEDDLERDQMAQDLMVEYAKILGEYGVKVDTAKIQAMQNMMRQPPIGNVAGGG